MNGRKAICSMLVCGNVMRESRKIITKDYFKIVWNKNNYFKIV